MRSIELTLKDGGTVQIELPEPGVADSCFLLGLPKAGSTLFYRIMRPISDRAGLAFYSLPTCLDQLGMQAKTVATGMPDVFKRQGYAYGGFRGIEFGIDLPDYASGRTVLLVRDPRDMVTSLYFSEAYSHKPPGAVASDALTDLFAARREAALAESIDEFAIRRGPDVLSVYEQTLAKLDGVAHRLDRYEDVIFAKHAWIEAVVDYLGLEIPPKQLAAIVGRHDITPDKEDVSQHIRRVAPGDHTDKLEPATIEQLNALFAPLLARFDYA